MKTLIEEDEIDYSQRTDIYNPRHDSEGWWAEFSCGARIGPYKVLCDLDREMAGLGFKTLTQWGEG